MEHHANIVPWHFLRERHGAVINWAPVDDDGNFLVDAFEKLLTDRTKMVAITHMSNVLGTIVPVKEIVRIAHERGIPVLVDGCQAAVHLDVDVRDIDCDFYVVTGHKLYGPTGIGVLYAKHEHLVAMPPFNGGGEMIREVFEDRITYGEPPHRFEAGTPAIVQAIGLGAAIDYVNSIGKARIRAHESDLVAYAHERLSEINSLRIVGTAKDKGALSRSISKARIRTISPPSSIAPASRCAPAPIARCRCSGVSAFRRRVGRRLRSTTPARRSIAWRRRSPRRGSSSHDGIVLLVRRSNQIQGTGAGEPTIRASSANTSSSRKFAIDFAVQVEERAHRRLNRIEAATQAHDPPEGRRE